MQRKAKSKKTKVESFALYLFTFAFLFTFHPLLALAQDALNTDRLFSPSVGQKFYEIAYELANSKNATESDLEQAIVFLTATTNLDSRANYVLPDMIKLACTYSEHDRSELVNQLLMNYANESADLEVTTQAIRYLLEKLDSREQREQLLKEILKNLGAKNPVLDSELATLLGLLMAEKTDLQAAQSYLMQAYNSNKHNRLAFAKLAELAPEQIDPAMYLEHLRLALGENPLDMEAALAFAQYAEQLQLYQTAADSYEYCVELFKYLNPSQALPSWLYLPWAISSYNTTRNQHRCLQIASDLRQSGRLDLFLEAIAAKAAAKIGDEQKATQILKTAEDKTRQLLISNDNSPKPTAEQLAWFYCFAMPDANKALDWANKAYSIEPNSPTASAVLAYSLVMNDQNDWAKLLIDNYNYEHNQIVDLTLAKIQLAQGQQSSAIETLKAAIARNPGSLVAEKAKEILTQLSSNYIAPIDPDIVLAALKNTFGQAVVPAFVTPEKVISVQLNARGNKFYYGTELDGTVVTITNNSSEPLVITDDSLFKGYIRVDANTSGDINKKIPSLVSFRVRPALPVEPGRSLIIPLRLVTGELRQILLTYPQASLDIEFTVYLDPVITDQGIPTNSLTDIKPASVVVKRPGVKLTGKYLRNRFNSLTKGQQGQKITTAQLFIGLLMEQNAMANREPLYKFMYADWMPPLLKSALLRNLADNDWGVKVHTMADMLSLPMDYELTAAVAENLNDTAYWPVRMMAIALLAKSQDRNFAKVLDWMAEYDPSTLIRDMAVALGAAKPQGSVTSK
jgi:tetratricopeptide (TPR) repeat protein